MLHDLFHEALGKALASMLREDVNVSQIGEGGPVGHDTAKADLPILVEDGEAQRIDDRPFNDGARDARRPIGLGEEAVDRVDIEGRLIARELIS